MKLPSVLELLVASLVLAAANKLSPAAEAIDAVGGMSKQKDVL